MSVYIASDDRVADDPTVRFLPEWANEPTIALKFGRTVVYVGAVAARKLADDILAELAAAVTP